MRTTRAAGIGLTLGALGVVFGDIGTSPLYALPAIFGLAGGRLAITEQNVLGILSVIIWSVTLVVTVKYIGFIMRAHNAGEGGILAQAALLKSGTFLKRYKWALAGIGLVGVALFYGDSAITPAISVLSAVEGLNLVAPDLYHLIVPLTLLILIMLFWLQKYGTGLIGALFGPIMLTWFLLIGMGGLWHILQHPDILRSLLPSSALSFIGSHPLAAFLSMSAVILTVTGAEALYADMGHFGRPPIRRAWLFVVFPALACCYLGQGVLLIYDTPVTNNILFRLFPEGLQLPAVLLATVATVIASQSVISGAFSLTRQAIQLNFLPKLLIRHTSNHSEGQIYIPFVNFLLFVTVVLLVVYFGASERLASAYGVAVSGALLADTLLFAGVVHFLWKKRWYIVIPFVAVFATLDLIFVTSSTTKVLHGGWIPLAIAAAILLVISTWQRGQRIVIARRKHIEGKLESFIEEVHSGALHLARVPGQAVYIGHHPGFTPLALRAAATDLHELHEKTVVVFIETRAVAHVPLQERAAFNGLKYVDGISELTLSYGYADLPNVPRDLAHVRSLSPELDFDPEQASYFISLAKAVPGNQRRSLAYWRKALYCLLANNARSRSDYYKLPVGRTIEMRSLIEL